MELVSWWCTHTHTTTHLSATIEVGGVVSDIWYDMGPQWASCYSCYLCGDERKPPLCPFCSPKHLGFLGGTWVQAFSLECQDMDSGTNDFSRTRNGTFVYLWTCKLFQVEPRSNSAVRFVRTSCLSLILFLDYSRSRWNGMMWTNSCGITALSQSTLPIQWRTRTFLVRGWPFWLKWNECIEKSNFAKLG